MVINHAEILDKRVAVVEIDGPLDSGSSPDFEDYINQLLIKKIVFILFDAKKMESVSSEGIGLLLLLQKKISETNGFFVIFNLSEEIQTLYQLLGFDKVFRITDTRADALQIMDRQIELRDKGISEPDESAKDTRVSMAATAQHEMEMSNTHAVPKREPVAGPQVMIVECSHCKSLIRISQDGDYICPHCNNAFTVMNTGNKPVSVAPAMNESMIVECTRCRSLVRIKGSGSYQCPDCDARFAVAKDMSVKF